MPFFGEMEIYIHKPKYLPYTLYALRAVVVQKVLRAPFRCYLQWLNSLWEVHLVVSLALLSLGETIKWRLGMFQKGKRSSSRVGPIRALIGGTPAFRLFLDLIFGLNLNRLL